MDRHWSQWRLGDCSVRNEKHDTQNKKSCEKGLESIYTWCTLHNRLTWTVIIRRYTKIMIRLHLETLFIAIYNILLKDTHNQWWCDWRNTFEASVFCLFVCKVKWFRWWWWKSEWIQWILELVDLKRGKNCLQANTYFESCKKNTHPCV